MLLAIERIVFCNVSIETNLKMQKSCPEKELRFRNLKSLCSCSSVFARQRFEQSIKFLWTSRISADKWGSLYQPLDSSQNPCSLKISHESPCVWHHTSNPIIKCGYFPIYLDCITHHPLLFQQLSLPWTVFLAPLPTSSLASPQHQCEYWDHGMCVCVFTFVWQCSSSYVHM